MVLTRGFGGTDWFGLCFQQFLQFRLGKLRGRCHFPDAARSARGLLGASEGEKVHGTAHSLVEFFGFCMEESAM